MPLLAPPRPCVSSFSPRTSLVPTRRRHRCFPERAHLLCGCSWRLYTAVASLKCYVTFNSFVFQTKLMDKDFYKDLEKIKTIGSTYMAAVGLAPTAGAKVGAGCQACPAQGLGPSSAPAAHRPRPGSSPWASACPLHWIRAAACRLSCPWLALSRHNLLWKVHTEGWSRDILPPCPLPTSPTPTQAAWHH